MKWGTATGCRREGRRARRAAANVTRFFSRQLGPGTWFARRPANSPHTSLDVGRWTLDLGPCIPFFILIADGCRRPALLVADVSLGFVNNVTKSSHLTSSWRHMVIDNWLDKVCVIQYGFTVTDGYYSTPSKTEWVRGAWCVRKGPASRDPQERCLFLV